MEILTLLRANIRRKKGTFISIMLLTAIVVTVITAVLSVRGNYDTALENAFEYADCGDINAYVKTERLTDELRSSVENSSLTDKVDYFPAICTYGTQVGNYSDGNSYLLMEMIGGIRAYAPGENAFEDSIPELKSGEIYLPLGLKYKLQCDVGDTVLMNMAYGKYLEFTVRGFVQEPSMGSMMIGVKNVFISHEDFERIYSEYKPLDEDLSVDYTFMRIHRAADCGLSAAKFQRQLNIETKIFDYSFVALNIGQTKNYSTLLPDMLLDVVLVFCIFLFMIVLIVMSHSIGTEIEIDYTTLGVLRSQGFSKGKIRAIIMLQYILAETVGIIAGSLAAIPIERAISGICKYITAVLPENRIYVGKNLLFIAVLLIVSAAVIYIRTIRIAKISPVRAISGGREEIFFDSRLNMPISKKCLSASLSFRQLTSAKKRYFGTMVITAILTFCMITIELVGTMLSSRYALNAMGLTSSDLSVVWTDTESDDKLDEIDELISSHTEIKQKNSAVYRYFSLNGENLFCEMFEYPEHISGILKGRAPLYDNELLITEMVADALDIQMGDEVTVTSQGNEERYIISGIYQSGNDSGMTFAMSFSGAERLGIDTDTDYRYYLLADPSQAENISAELRETYGDNVDISVYDEADDPEMELFDMIVTVLKLVIYSFSVLFAFIVIRMVCSKAFIRERTDIGIYKAVGFTSGRLRLSFAIRFLIVSVLGAAVGAVLSALLTERILSLLFRLIGLSKLVLDYTAGAVLIPIGAICLSSFVFAYISSRKVKNVEIRELISE